MAIFTRFGSEVKIISVAEYPEGKEVIIQYDAGNAQAVWPHQLKADGGLTEIQQAMDNVNR